MPYPRSPAAIEAQIKTVAAAHPAICARTDLPHPTHEKRKVPVVKIGKGGGQRRVVVITGGHHAREWAPPDLLLTLIQRLLTAYDDDTSLTVPAFTDVNPVPPITYPPYQLPLPDVRRIVDRLDVYIVPLVNPDGRNFSMAPGGNKEWRKNRRPQPAGQSPACKGVDPNRNYPVPGDYQLYYSVAAEPAVSASKDPCEFQTYVGPQLGAEPEVQNIIGLLTSMTVDYFVDVHSYAHKILFSWGIEGSQSDDLTQNWRNTLWDRSTPAKGRDGKPGGFYNEYIPNDPPERLQDVHRLIAGEMRDAMVRAAGGDPRARERSSYGVGPSADLYPAPGVSTEYAFSRNLVPGTPRPLISLCIECGSELNLEGGFRPPAFIFPKIEREVQIALLTLLARAAAQPRP